MNADTHNTDPFALPFLHTIRKLRFFFLNNCMNGKMQQLAFSLSYVSMLRDVHYVAVL